LTEAIVELVKAGLGVAVLARWAVDPYLKAGTVRALSVTRRGYHRVWSAAMLKDMARVPYVREFVDLIATHPPFAKPVARRETIAPAPPTRSASRPAASSRRSRERKSA
jgi:hypothetical protein